MTKDTIAWSIPKDVDDASVAFPANVIGKILPPMEDIPEEFTE